MASYFLCCRQIKTDFNRKRHEEAIAAFLVVPTPQNLVLARNNPLDKASGNECATRCVLYSLRLLQSLGEYVIDANKQYFTALSLLDEGMPGLSAWLPVYPSGRPADFYQKRAWVDPVCRLYKTSARIRANRDDAEGLSRSLIQLLNSQMPVKKAHVPVKVHASSATAEEEASSDDGGSDFSDPDASSDEEEKGVKGSRVPGIKQPAAANGKQSNLAGKVNPMPSGPPALVSQSHSLNLSGSSGFRLPGLNRGNIISGMTKDSAALQLAQRQQQQALLLRQQQEMLQKQAMQYQQHNQSVLMHQQQMAHQQQQVYPIGTHQPGAPPNSSGLYLQGAGYHPHQQMPMQMQQKPQMSQQQLQMHALQLQQQQKLQLMQQEARDAQQRQQQVTAPQQQSVPPPVVKRPTPPPLVIGTPGTQAADQVWQRGVGMQSRVVMAGMVEQLVQSAADLLGLRSQAEMDTRVQQFELTLLVSGECGDTLCLLIVYLCFCF
jgi:hypothetical protein